MEILLTVAPNFPPRARAWLDELPNIPCTVAQYIEGRLAVSGAAQAKRSMAALEVFIASGGRFSYGLLGGEFFPGGSDELAVQVAVCQTGQPITDWSLARGLDAVKAGIPPWAAEDIVNATLETAKTQPIGSGSLRFTLGAHGEIGSSSWVFRGLAGAIVKLLSTDGPLSEEGLAEIVRTQFNAVSRTTDSPRVATV
jgi:hypothetical protein